MITIELDEVEIKQAIINYISELIDIKNYNPNMYKFDGTWCIELKENDKK